MLVLPGSSLSSAVDPGQRQQLVHRIRHSGLPIRVAPVPLVEGDSWGGDARQLAEVIHDRMGGGPSIVITLGAFSPSIAAHEWPADAHHAQRAAAAVFHQHDMAGAGLPKRLTRAIDIIEAGNGDKVYEQATAGLRAPAPEAGSSSSPLARLLTLAIGPMLLLATAGLLLRRSRLRELSTPFALPRSVFAAAPGRRGPTPRPRGGTGRTARYGGARRAGRSGIRRARP
ncbi:hypothetical protein [Streptomyces sp. x-80]|uniref:hypothetical protein n=1 Tax=Streptomyces sp. x-80 TaxID=2789282 RepID=UPI003980BF92